VLRLSFWMLWFSYMITVSMLGMRRVLLRFCFLRSCVGLGPAGVIENVAKNKKTQISCIDVFKDLRPSQPFKGSLYEVADWISEHVLKPLVVEVDTCFAIRILRDADDYVTISVMQLHHSPRETPSPDVYENLPTTHI